MNMAFYSLCFFIFCQTSWGENNSLVLLEEGQSYNRKFLKDKYLCRTSDTESLFTLESWKDCSSVSADKKDKLLWKKLDFEIKKPIVNPLYFSYYLALEDSVELWLYRNDILIDMQVSGSSYQLEQRPFSAHSIAIPLLVRDPGNYTAFLRTISHNPQQTGPAISNSELVESSYRVSEKVIFPYLGVGIAVLIINILMFIFLRKKTYVPYILFHGLFVFSVLVITGHTVNFLPMVQGGYAQYFPLLVSAVGVFYLWFSAWYFQVRLRKSLLFIPLFCFSLLNFITWPFDGPTLVTQEIFFGFVIIMCVFTLFQYKRDPDGSRFFLLSWGGYTFFVIIYSLYKNGLIPPSHLVRFSAIIGHIWEMTFFTVAIAHQMIKELKIAKIVAVKSEESKDNLLQQLAHELKTPMTGILGGVDQIQNSKIDVDVIDLSHSTYQLEHMINNIIDSTEYLGVNSSKVLEIGWVDVASLVNAKVKSVSDEYKPIQTLVQLPELNYLIQTHEKIYTKVILQFLDNAFKFNEKGPVQVEINWTENSFRLKIVNGVLSDPRKSLGEKKSFDLRQMNRGLGFGYLIGQKGMNDIRGDIETNYYEDQCLFEVILDLPIGERKPVQGPHQEIQFNKLLVVDDNKINRKVLGRIGEQLGYDVLFAENGFSALKCFIKNQPDIVFMDIQMPIMDGFKSTELIRQFEDKENKNRSCILGITAHGTNFYESKCKEVGMDFMLNKPVKKDQIHHAIQSLMIKK